MSAPQPAPPSAPLSAPLAAEARAALSDPHEALRRLAAAAEALELAADPAPADGLALSGQGWSVTARPAAGALELSAAAVNAAVLRGVKEMAAHMLGEIDPAAAEALRWSDGARTGEPPADFRRWSLLARRPVMPGLDRLVFQADDAVRYAGAPMHVRLLVPPCDGHAAEWPRQKPNGGLAWPGGPATLAARVYTVRRAAADRGEVEVDAVVHGDDLLAGWAARARPGWRLGVLGPSGAPPADDGPLLAAADMSALPALARTLAAAPGRRGVAVIAAPAEAEAYLSPPPGVRLRRLPPGTGAETLADALLAEAEAEPEAGARWWFAAEARGVRRLRARLDALGVARDRRECVAYWRA